MFRLTSLATALLSLFMLSAPASAYEAITGPLGLLAYDKAKAYDGYTLFTPHTKVSSWNCGQNPGSRQQKDLPHRYGRQYCPYLEA